MTTAPWPRRPLGSEIGHGAAMMNSSLWLEKFLQDYRFNVSKPYLIGDVLDFGGNKGELQKFVAGKYILVNYDHSAMEDACVDTIVSLAVIEHVEFDEALSIFQKFKKILNAHGRVLLTMPTPLAKPALELLALLRILDKRNIAEHKHYWSKNEIYALAKKTGFVVKKYQTFQVGFNQLVILEHA